MHGRHVGVEYGYTLQSRPLYAVHLGPWRPRRHTGEVNARSGREELTGEALQVGKHGRRERSARGHQGPRPESFIVPWVEPSRAVSLGCWSPNAHHGKHPQATSQPLALWRVSRLAHRGASRSRPGRGANDMDCKTLLRLSMASVAARYVNIQLLPHNLRLPLP